MRDWRRGDEIAATMRRVYGRGLYDGLRRAGVSEPEEFMNAAKIEAAEKSLNGIAKKVYEAVPVQEEWSVTQIIRELSRCGSNPDHKVVMGCIVVLVEKGLVREPRRGLFIKAPQREKPRLSLKVVATPDPHAPAPAEKTEPEAAMKTDHAEATTAPKAATVEDPLSRLAALAVKAKQAGEALIAVASEIEDVAVAVDEQAKKVGADMDKFRQLQALLKGLGT